MPGAILPPCPKCGASDRLRNGACRPCARARFEKWKSTHHEDYKQSKAKWRANPANRKKESAGFARWSRGNREHLNAARVEWNRKNTEANRAIYVRKRCGRRRAPGSHTASEWAFTLASYHGLCVYCLSMATTRDHVEPLAGGGGNEISNIAPACRSCNSKKNTRGLLVWLARQAAT